MSKIVSMHQPNFLGRMSFFEKIAQSDVFVIMGHCQYTRGGFQNRFNVGNRFYGMAVNEGKLCDKIIDKRYKDAARDWSKINTLFPKTLMFHDCISESLYGTNCKIIARAMHILNIKTEIAFDYPITLTGTARLVDICKTHNATHYLSGVSGRNYLDLSLFDAAGIEVIFQDENKMDKRPLVECL